MYIRHIFCAKISKVSGEQITNILIEYRQINNKRYKTSHTCLQQLIHTQNKSNRLLCNPPQGQHPDVHSKRL